MEWERKLPEECIDVSFLRRWKTLVKLRDLPESWIADILLASGVSWSRPVSSAPVLSGSGSDGVLLVDLGERSPDATKLRLLLYSNVIDKISCCRKAVQGTIAHHFLSSNILALFLRWGFHSSRPGRGSLTSASRSPQHTRV